MELIQSARQFLSSSATDQVGSDRWDWLAETSWYVPTENLLAYTMGQDLADPQTLADQTLWRINQSSNGQIAGDTVAKLSLSPVPTYTTFTGVITQGGQVRMEFAGESPTTGIGQMRFVDGAWRVQMQMATGITSIVSHWAYMSQVTPDVTPPEPSNPTPDGSLLSDEWRWLVGTQWGIRDTALFGSDTSPGIFEIDSFRNGYFWGSGTGTEPFNVFGSVTPEGNVLLLMSVSGAQAAVRTGIMRPTASGEMMTLRTYEGTPAVGWAWTLGPDASH